MIVLDTHVWVWWVTQDPQLPRRVARLIEARGDSESVFVSSISVWEARCSSSATGFSSRCP